MCGPGAERLRQAGCNPVASPATARHASSFWGGVLGRGEWWGGKRGPPPPPTTAYRGEAARGRRAGNARRGPGRTRLGDLTVSEILTGPGVAPGLGIPPSDPRQPRRGSSALASDF